MNSGNIFRLLELLALFIGLPIVLLLDVHPSIKVVCILLGVVYCLFIVWRKKEVKLSDLYRISSTNSWKFIFYRFFLFGVMSALLMYFFDYENLFIVVIQKPLMWIAITFFYSVFSVYPQEFLYRTFFFFRYKEMVKSPTAFIIINALFFSFAHIAFKNALVLTLTFAGGILFALTYTKSKSLMLTSIEHALYGSWLFTIGMGEMLAFPSV